MKPLGLKTIKIEMKEGKAGLVYGTSPDLKGLFIAKRDRTQVLKNVPRVIAALYHASGVETVDVLRVSHSAFIARPNQRLKWEEKIKKRVTRG